MGCGLWGYTEKGVLRSPTQTACVIPHYRKKETKEFCCHRDPGPVEDRPRAVKFLKERVLLQSQSSNGEAFKRKGFERNLEVVTRLRDLANALRARR